MISNQCRNNYKYRCYYTINTHFYSAEEVLNKNRLENKSIIAFLLCELEQQEQLFALSLIPLPLCLSVCLSVCLSLTLFISLPPPLSLCFVSVSLLLYLLPYFSLPLSSFSNLLLNFYATFNQRNFL